MAKKQTQKTFAEVAELELTSGEYEDFSSFSLAKTFTDDVEFSPEDAGRDGRGWPAH